MSDLNMQSSSSFNMNYEVEYDIAEEEANIIMVMKISNLFRKRIFLKKEKI